MCSLSRGGRRGRSYDAPREPLRNQARDHDRHDRLRTVCSARALSTRPFERLAGRRDLGWPSSPGCSVSLRRSPRVRPWPRQYGRSPERPSARAEVRARSQPSHQRLSRRGSATHPRTRARTRSQAAMTARAVWHLRKHPGPSSARSGPPTDRMSGSEQRRDTAPQHPSRPRLRGAV